jgi:hypothetical protein
MAIKATASEPVEASTLPYDFFREVHKGLRLALFAVTEEVGAADCGRPDIRARIATRVVETITLLHAHHGHEDAFIAPLLDGHQRRLRTIVDAGHAEIDAELLEIERLTTRLSDSEGSDAIIAGLELYHYLSLFTARYLAHMALEEGEVMASLRDAMPVRELFDVDMRLRGAVAPDLMCRFITVMVPAMNPDERFSMLAGMQAGAPAEIFERFRATAFDSLPAPEADALADRLANR